jgi:hypothetical protein
MEIMYDGDGKLVYLYRVIDGLCTRSQAFSAAVTVGLPDSIVQRANEVCDLNVLFFFFNLKMIDFSYSIKSKIIKYFILFEILLIWKSNTLLEFILIESIQFF